MPGWFEAGLWGWLAGSALLIGALIGYRFRVPQRAVWAVMAFGSGVLISTLAFALVDEAYRRGGLLSTALGFLAGAAVFTGANVALARRGARHRKRSGALHPSEQDAGGSGKAIAIGALLDGIPESIVVGLGLLQDGAVSRLTVVAIFLSNLPEGLSSAAGMRRAGRGALYVFGVWGGIALVSGVAAIAGYTLYAGSAPEVVAATTAVAAGAILAMLCDTMIPEAFETSHDLAGLITAAGFLAAFALSKQG